MHLGLAGGAPGFEPEPFSLLWQRSMLQSLRASLRETQRLVRRNRSSMAEQDAARWPRSLLDDGDRLLDVFDVLRTRKLDAAPHPGPRRSAPRPGAVDRPRRRVHRLRGRAGPADRRALDQALPVERRRRDRPLARLRRAGRAGDVERAWPRRRDPGGAARAVAAGVDRADDGGVRRTATWRG